MRRAECPLRRLGRHAFRGGNSNETQSLPMPLSERLDGERRRRPGAEPDGHAILDKFNRLLRSYALEGIPPVAGLGSGRGHERIAAALAFVRMAAIAAA